MYYWKILKRRKNEDTRTDLPKATYSEEFDTLTEAIVFSNYKKQGWIQGALFDKSNTLYHKQIGSCKRSGIIKYTLT